MAKPAEFKKVVAGMKKMSKEQRMEMTKEWAELTKRADMKDGGAPLGKNMRVTAKGGKLTSNEIGGYSMIEANTLAEAAKKMKSSPHLKMIKKGWIDVMEILPM